MDQEDQNVTELTNATANEDNPEKFSGMKIVMTCNSLCRNHHKRRCRHCISQRQET